MAKDANFALIGSLTGGIDPRGTCFRSSRSRRWRGETGVLCEEGFRFFSGRKGFRALRYCERGKTRRGLGRSGGGRNGGTGGSTFAGQRTLAHSFERGSFLFWGANSRRTLAESAADGAAGNSASSKPAKTGFEVFATGAAFSCKDGKAGLGAFKGSLGNFDWGLSKGTNARASRHAATKTGAGSLGGFGDGAADQAGSAKRGNVSGAFERGLHSSSSGSSAGASDVAGLLDLAFDVRTKERREGGGRATQNAACDPPTKA